MFNSRALSLRGLSISLALVLLPAFVFAGGPKHVAGTTYFSPGVVGQPVHWDNGQVSYYVDQGSLSATVTNQQAVAMVDAAAALWNAIPTAGVTIVDKGALNEDVSGLEVVPGNQTIAQPSDVAASATNYPVGSSSTPMARCSMASSAPTPATPPTARPTAWWCCSTTSTPMLPSPMRS